MSSQAMRQKPLHPAFTFVIPNASPLNPGAKVSVQHAARQNSVAEVKAQP